MDKEKLRKSIDAMHGVADEANTIVKYLETLLAENYDENSAEVYTEIISDEFNHVIRFTALASDLCGIEVAED